MRSYVKHGVKFFHDALAQALGSGDRAASYDNLANAALARFEQTGRMEELEQCIKLHRSALALCPVGHPDRSAALNNLANAVLTRFEHTGQTEDVDEGITLHGTALSLRPPGHKDRFASLDNLATALFTRFGKTGRMQDLEECIHFHRSALGLCLPGQPYRAVCLGNLANAMLFRFEQAGLMEDLEMGIKLYRDALALHPVGHPDRPASLNNVANAVYTRFKHMGRMEDLWECIKLSRDALVLHSLRHTDRMASLKTFATAGIALFEQTGQMEDLEECISLLRTTLALVSPTDSDRSMCLSNLANALLARFNQTGRMEDLEECIELNRTALSLFPLDHPNRPVFLTHLASAVTTHFEQTNRKQDLEERFELQRAALALCPLDHADRSAYLSNLAGTEAVWFEQTGQVEDLEECIKLHRSALALRAPGHPYRSLSLNNLANALLVRFKQKGQIGDLERCINLHGDALVLRPLGHPDRSASLDSLATALLILSSRTGSEKDVREAFDLYRCGVEHQFSSVATRLQTSLHWATFARQHDHSSALDAYKASLSLLARLLAIDPAMQLQRQHLMRKGSYSTVGLDAASFAIQAGNFVEAIEMLEQGRAVLWSSLYRLRTPVEELRQIDKALANQFLETNRRLESLSTSSEHRPVPLSLHHQRATNAGSGDRIGGLLSTKRHLEDSRLALLAKIRALSGDNFKSFLLAEPFTVLRNAAAAGPVVVVNVTKSRCDALVMLKNHDSPVCVPLGANAYGAISKLSTRLLGTRKSLATREREYNSELRETLKGLWEMIVGPVTKKLLELGIQPGSRVWWYPTSVLGTLPLHAAGVISPTLPEAPMAKYLPDIFISSYTTTLMALVRARSSFPLPADNEPPSMLVVWNERSLASVHKEVTALREVEPSLRELHCSDQVTSERVVEELKEHSWVHFACHGQLVHDQPFESAFLLSGDARLTLLDIIRSRLPNAKLAFLACHSAELTCEGGYEEVLPLVAAMQFCGFHSVVGTMWEMAEIDGPHVTKEFYRVLFAEGGAEKGSKEAARAIRDAAKSLRDIKDMTLERWVNYVHFGV